MKSMGKEPPLVLIAGLGSPHGAWFFKSLPSRLPFLLGVSDSKFHPAVKEPFRHFCCGNVEHHDYPNYSKEPNWQWTKAKDFAKWGEGENEYNPSNQQGRHQPHKG